MSAQYPGLPLVFIETEAGVATPGSVGLLAKARQIAGGAAAVVCGPAAEQLAASLHRYGADEAWFCDLPDLDPELPGPHIDAIAYLMGLRGSRTVLFETSVVAMDIAAGLAARLDGGVNWDLQDLLVQDDELVGTRFALGDIIEVEVGWVGDPRLAVFRTGMLEPLEHPVSGSIQRFEPPFSQHSRLATVQERRKSTGAGVRLSTAEVIVAGGRGVRDAGSLGLLEELAAALGGVVAVSMPLVDRGWYPAANQVGQTGQKVRPRLYVACGISGALAHRVGMEKSGTIVAINSDPSAPVFGLCDAGVVGDLHEVVPELTRLVLARGTSGDPAAG